MNNCQKVKKNDGTKIEFHLLRINQQTTQRVNNKRAAEIQSRRYTHLKLNRITFAHSASNGKQTEMKTQKDYVFEW